MSEISMSHKFCYKCDTLKHVSEFYKSKAHYNRYNVTSQCKRCLHQINLKYRRTHRNKVKQQNKRYYDMKKDRELRKKLLLNMSYDDTMKYIENRDLWTDRVSLSFLSKNQRSKIEPYDNVIDKIEDQ